MLAHNDVCGGHLLNATQGRSARTSTSTVSGCITDTMGRALPGVTVDVGGNGRHRIVQSDPREDGHGAFPRPDAIRESLDWLDKYLGPARR